MLDRPILKLTIFVALVSFVTYLLFARKTLRVLDPSSVVPGRVKTALDTLTEGVVLLVDPVPFVDLEFVAAGVC